MTRITALAAAGLLALALPGAASAQGTTCQGRVFIDSVYQTGVGGDRFEYFFILRNQTNQRITADVALQNFPSNVTLFSPNLPNIAMGPNATVSPNTRFGNGTNSNISMQTVARAYDNGAATGPTIRVTNCRAG
jgi:carbohydrate-binding DOMON domain-containing protein